MSMKRSAHTFFLALAAVALPAAAQAKPSHGGDGVHIEGAGQENRHLDCNGGSAHIQGASNELTITGACSSLTIEGAANIVRIDLAPGAPVRIGGASNQVNWSMPGNARPRLSIQGAANRVQRVR